MKPLPKIPATGGLLALVCACASVPQHDPMYDGGFIPEPTPADTTTLIPITLRNNRTNDAVAPTFYLVSLGRHSLGIVQGYGGIEYKFADTRWFKSDGCMTIVAHYAGGPEWTSHEFCWQRGNVIDAHIEDIWSTSDAWAHR